MYYVLVGRRVPVSPKASAADDNRSSAGLQSLLQETSQNEININSSSKKTTFAALPQVTTTWQQQQLANVHANESTSSDTGTGLICGTYY